MGQRRVKDVRFYRGAYRASLTAVRVSFVVILLLLASIATCLLRRSPTQFYATSNAGGFAQVTAFPSPESVRVTVVTGERAYRQGIGF
jgi:multidrug efflux pump subunit AcrB